MKRKANVNMKNKVIATDKKKKNVIASIKKG